MGLKGNLNDISLENIFQMLFVERKDGLLSIQYGDRTAEVFLEKGRVSFAKLGEQREGLRVKLTVIKNGYLTEQQWVEFIGPDPSPKLEKIFSDLSGRIADDLFSFLFLREIKYTFFCLLQWRKGLYEYFPEARPCLDRGLWKSLGGEYLLLEAVREVEHWRGGQAKLPSLNSSVLMVDNFLSAASNLRNTFTPDEAYIASMVSEEINLEDLLNSSKLSYCETGTIIEKFMSHRLLKVRRALKEVSLPEKGSGIRTGGRWVEYVVLLVLIFCMLLIGDATFFDSSIKKYIYTLLVDDSAEKTVPEEDDIKKLSTESLELELEKGREGGFADSRKDFENKMPADEGRSAPGSGSLNERARQENKSDNEPEVDELVRRAENGDVDAQLSLGFIYDFGRGGVGEDDAKAAAWYMRAAEEAFNPEAQFNLGVMYKNGEGVKKDSVEAARWYRKAASQGYSQAQYNLALMYLEGDGIEPDKEKALTLLYRAGVSFWKEGNDDAVRQVVNIYRRVDPDSVDAKKLLFKVNSEN